jgi:homoserine kinase
MCDLLYTEINKKVNKGKSFSRIVKDNLLQVASFMDTHPDNINPSMTEIKKLGVKRWSNSNQNIDTFIRAVQLRYNRLVRDKRKEFLEMRSNKAARIFTYAADNS